jgi:hypothetical protein
MVHTPLGHCNICSQIGFSNQKERENKFSMSYLDVGWESEPCDLFVFAINAEQTREKYISRLKKFLELLALTRNRS